MLNGGAPGGNCPDSGCSRDKGWEAGGNLEQLAMERWPGWPLYEVLGHNQNAIFKRCPWLPGGSSHAGVQQAWGPLWFPRWESKAWGSGSPGLESLAPPPPAG